MSALQVKWKVTHINNHFLNKENYIFHNECIYIMILIFLVFINYSYNKDNYIISIYMIVFLLFAFRIITFLTRLILKNSSEAKMKQIFNYGKD